MAKVDVHITAEDQKGESVVCLDVHTSQQQDLNDMVQAELERIRQNIEKRFVACEADIERILNDRSRLATENRELQRKYQSLKDMYLDLCAKS